MFYLGYMDIRNKKKKINRRNRKRGGRFEKVVADFLGFEVVPYSGSNARYGYGDVRGDKWLIECKNITLDGDKLTIQQLIILFEATLNISLDPIFLNQSALAKLIAGISGYKFESIRSKIASRIDYDNKYVKADASKVAALIKEIRPDLAEKIINNTKE